VFSGRVRCRVCGGDFGPKVWHSNSKYRKVVWQCNDKYADKERTCAAPNLSEDALKAMYVEAVNNLISDRDRIIRGFDGIKDTVFDTSEDEAQLEGSKRERLDIVARIEELTRENASVAMDQDAYKKRFEQLSERYAEINKRLAALDEAVKDMRYRRTKTELFIRELGRMECLVTEFSGELWHALADHATVYGKEDVRFTFRNGLEVKA
jgi:site-specific DNA recombinase